MSGFICARCLSRPTIPRLATTLFNAASFSVLSQLQKSPPKKISKKSGPTKTVGSWQNKGAPAGKQSRQIAPGERKAFRKKIVLSNSNALEVAGLELMSSDNASGREHQGQLLALPDKVVSALQANGSFKPTQAWNLFRRPATLVRQDTLAVADLLDNGEAATSSRPTLRRILYGPRGSGKSLLLMQAMSMAFLKGWVVIHLADTSSLASGNTSYAPDPEDVEGTTYLQPDATAALLTAIAQSNSTVLSDLRLEKEHKLQVPVQSNISLQGLAEMGASDKQLAWPVYKALFNELTAPGRPPILFAVDSISPLLCPTRYYAPDMTSIHGQDLSLGRHTTSILSGATTLPNGGLALFEDSQCNRPSNPSFDFAVKRLAAIAQRCARSSNSDAMESKRSRKPSGEINEIDQALRNVDAYGIPKWNALVPCDQKVMELFVRDEEQLDGLDVLHIGGLSRDETRSVLEYYARSGLLRARVDSGLVGEKWTLSGGGVVGELERACLRIV